MYRYPVTRARATRDVTELRKGGFLAKAWKRLKDKVQGNEPKTYAEAKEYARGMKSNKASAGVSIAIESALRDFFLNKSKSFESVQSDIIKANKKLVGLSLSWLDSVRNLTYVAGSAKDSFCAFTRLPKIKPNLRYPCERAGEKVDAAAISYTEKKKLKPDTNVGNFIDALTCAIKSLDVATYSDVNTGSVDYYCKRVQTDAEADPNAKLKDITRDPEMTRTQRLAATIGRKAGGWESAWARHFAERSSH
jgi:hypothetical protein